MQIYPLLEPSNSSPGGVQGETAPRLVKAGVDVLVSGSYVFKSPQPEQVIRALRSL